ncbi:hypothetical protein [Horticoccus sp. 23ND18S-11]|uniref:hypothetical protein n=1 Tax=Horticoccus sp. 23ND18S-11 TaxID=3391832 RepID=UPI0039C9AF66
MLRFDPIPEIQLLGVFDAGVPNRERIAFQIKLAVNLGNYAVVVGWKGSDGSAIPLPDQFYWLGEQWVDADSILLLYSGSGTRQTGMLQELKKTYLALHWGKPSVIFDNPNFAPLLFQIGAVGFTDTSYSLLAPKTPSLPTPSGTLPTLPVGPLAGAKAPPYNPFAFDSPK